MNENICIEDVIFGLNEIEGIGWVTIDQIVRRMIEGKHSFRSALQYLSHKKRNKIESAFTKSYLQVKKNFYHSKQVGWLTFFDERYPLLLKEIAQPPWILYFQGNAELLKNPLISIVGTRTPTTYGKLTSNKIAHELSDLGITTVSGFARGIDTSAHEGALQGKGSTIAVFGTGIDQVYPVENNFLYHKIVKDGLILSEYPYGMKARKGTFPQRNRIIAGLSIATIVVEAAQKSGSLITAHFSLEENRDVFAVPGAITSPKSTGTNKLIQQSAAQLVMETQDIIQALPEWWIKNLELIEETDLKKTKKQEESLTENEQLVYEQISAIPITFEKLMAETQLEFGHLHSVLLSLIMKLRIQQLPGSQYITI